MSTAISCKIIHYIRKVVIINFQFQRSANERKNCPINNFWRILFLMFILVVLHVANSWTEATSLRKWRTDTQVWPNKTLNLRKELSVPLLLLARARKAWKTWRWCVWRHLPICFERTSKECVIILLIRSRFAMPNLVFNIHIDVAKFAILLS